MSDNTTITPGAGASVAADNISSVLYQRVKVAWGVDGAAVDASATDPFPVDIVDGSLSLTSGDDPLTVGGDSDVVSVLATITNGAYSAGDVVGGPITLTNALGTLRSGVLQQMTLSLNGTIAALPQMKVYLFGATPAQVTADNGVFNWVDGDGALKLWEWTINNATTDTINGIGDWLTTPGATVRHVAQLPGNIVVKSTADQNLYLLVATITAFTAVSTGMRIRAGLTRD